MGRYNGLLVTQNSSRETWGFFLGRLPDVSKLTGPGCKGLVGLTALADAGDQPRSLAPPIIGQCAPERFVRDLMP